MSRAVERGWPIASICPTHIPPTGEPATLASLTLSPNTATAGSAYSGTVTGKTAGSTLTLTGTGAAGLSVSGATITGTPTADGLVNIVETLASATNSPRTTSNALTVGLALPSAVSGLLRAWDFADASTRTTDADGLATISGAWGTSSTATGAASTAKPTIAAGFGAINDDVASFTRANSQRMTFPALTASSLHIFIVMDVKQISSGDHGLLGRTSSSTSRVKLVASASGNITAEFAANGGSATNVAMPLRTWPNRFQLVEFKYDMTAGTLTPALDGVEGSAVSIGTGGLLFEQIGAYNGANFLDGYIGAIAIYDHVLSSEDVAKVRAYFRQRTPATFYISSSGSDANRGDRADRAWATLGKVEGLTTQCRPGDTYVMTDGFKERRTAQFTPPIGGTSVRPITLKAASAHGAIATGADAFTSGWTDNGDGTWSRPQATTPVMVWLVEADDSYGPKCTHIVNRSTSTDYSYQYSAGTLTVRAASGINLNAREVRVTSGSFSFFSNATRGYWKFQDFDIWHMPVDALQQSADGIHSTGQRLMYCANDAYGPGSGSGHILENFLIRGAGKAKSDNSADGDGISHHGTASGIVRNGIILECLKAGIDDERSTSVAYTNVEVINSNHNVRLLNQGTGDGVLSLTNCTVRRKAGDANPAVEMESGLGSGNVLTATGCTFINEAGGGAAAVVVNGGTFVNGGSNTLTGYATLT